MIGSTTMMNSLVDKMSWQIAKGERLAKNIANIDMPGYKRVDIESFQNVYNTKKGSHGNLSFREIRTSEPVTREGEIMHITENVVEYQTNLQLFKKYLGLLKTVIGARTN